MTNPSSWRSEPFSMKREKESWLDGAVVLEVGGSPVPERRVERFLTRRRFIGAGTRQQKCFVYKQLKIIRDVLYKTKENKQRLRTQHLAQPSLARPPPSHPRSSACAPHQQSTLSHFQPLQSSQLGSSSPSQRPNPPTPSSPLERLGRRSTKSSRPIAEPHWLEGSPRQRLDRRLLSTGWKSL